MRRLWQLAIFIILLLAQGCQDDLNGYLRVVSKEAGSFEIYQLASESPLQLTAEQVGVFNQTMELPAGQFLILTDCSSKEVIIRAGEYSRFVVHELVFQPTSLPTSDDIFMIQCDRHSKTMSHQTHLNQFSLNVVAGHSLDLLVGSKSFHPGAYLDKQSQPLQMVFPLASLTVADYEGSDPGARFFVSPQEDLISLTQQQELGKRLFVLPGTYTVEVNGTELEVTLAAGEDRVIRPAFIKLEVPGNVDLRLSSSIRGTPLYAELNDQHHVELNAVYPVMPGAAQIRVSGSSEEQIVQLKEDQLLEVPVRALLVRSDCPPWDWSCLGNIKVFVYDQNKNYIIATGVTDVPILYLQDQVHVSLQGSKDISQTVLEQPLSHVFQLGWLETTPIREFKPGLITDLVRVEAIGAGHTGKTLDFSLVKPERLALIAGRYRLDQFQSVVKSEGDRYRRSQHFTIAGGKTQKLTYTVVVPDPAKVNRSRPAKREHRSLRDKNSALIPHRLF